MNNEQYKQFMADRASKNKEMVQYKQDNPQVTYQQLADKYGVSRQRAHAVINKK